MKGGYTLQEIEAIIRGEPNIADPERFIKTIANETNWRTVFDTYTGRSALVWNGPLYPSLIDLAKAHLA